jgi:hypothetical protein
MTATRPADHGEIPTVIGAGRLMPLAAAPSGPLARISETPIVPDRAPPGLARSLNCPDRVGPLPPSITLAWLLPGIDVALAGLNADES